MVERLKPSGAVWSYCVPLLPVKVNKGGKTLKNTLDSLSNHFLCALACSTWFQHAAEDLSQVKHLAVGEPAQGGCS